MFLVAHMRSKKQLAKTLKITFTSQSKSTDEKEKERKKRKAIAKRFALHANAIILSWICGTYSVFHTLCKVTIKT